MKLRIRISLDYKGCPEYNIESRPWWWPKWNRHCTLDNQTKAEEVMALLIDPIVKQINL